MAKTYGFSIKGISSGVDSYLTKNNTTVYQLFVVVPGTRGIVEINFQDSISPEKFPIGTDVDVPCIPRFYNGKVSGFTAI